MKKLLSYLDPRTLLGRNLFTLVFMLALCAVLAVTIVVQSRQLKKERQEYISLYQSSTEQMRINALRLQRVSADSKVYLLTGDTAAQRDYQRGMAQLQNDLWQGADSMFTLFPNENWQTIEDRLQTVLLDFEALVFRVEEEISSQYSMAEYEARYDTTGTVTVSGPEIRQTAFPAFAEDHKDLSAKMQEAVDDFLAYVRPMERASAQQQKDISNRILYVVLSISIVAATVMLLLALTTARTIRRSINSPVRLLRDLAKGKLSQSRKAVKNELMPLVEYGNTLSDNLRKASEFALAVGEGNYDHEFDTISDEDVLGQALLQMRQRLSQVAQEERMRSWSNETFAKFARILRNTSHDFGELGDQLLAQLMKSLGLVQGALYIAEGDENSATTPTLKLVASYAYDRKKHDHHEVEPGQGLVGQVFLDNKLMEVKKLPPGYPKIISGMGQTAPRYLIVLPLAYNEKVEGVLELAGLKVLERHQVSFLEELSATVASTLASVKINATTKKLLQESQLQGEQMRSQEEEMRQNMEEMQATNEELERQKQEANQVQERLKQREAELLQEIEALKAGASQPGGTT